MGICPRLDYPSQGRPQGRSALAPGRDLGVENHGEGRGGEEEAMEDEEKAMEDEEKATEDEEKAMEDEE